MRVTNTQGRASKPQSVLASIWRSCAPQAWVLLPCLAGCASSSGGASAHGQAAGYHDRPIVERKGQRLLWAGEDEWFDVTDSAINPEQFQYGIGKDSIASIDDPEFAPFSDPRVEQASIGRETPVIGVFREGEARAYPVDLMSMHEIVNDNFAGVPYAVMW